MAILYDITIIDLDDKKVVGFGREVGDSPQEAFGKVRQQMIGAGMIQEKKQYHAHIAALTSLPGTPSVIVPNTAVVREIVASKE